MSADQKRRVLRCASIAPGMALGPVYAYRDIDLAVLETKRFAVENVADEADRLDLALVKSKNQLREIRAIGPHTSDSGTREIFDVQLALLDDAGFLAEIRSLLAEQRVNLEHLIASKIRQVSAAMSGISDEMVRSKISDIHDTYHRILRNLLEIDHVRTHSLQRITSRVILVSERLMPSDLALLDLSCILGVVLEEISMQSHVAIMLRSFGIPAVGNVPAIASLLRQGDTVLVDAENGSVIVAPSAADQAVLKRWRLQSKTRHQPRQIPLPNATRDGIKVLLEANAGSIAETREAAASGADGIGLLRSEIFFLSKSERPSLGEEAAFYRSIFKTAGSLPVTVRLLDIGADKRPPYMPVAHEENPQLGVRGIRYLLTHPDLLEQQCRALLEASGDRGLRILVPFVTLHSEAEAVVSLFESILKKGGKNRRHVEIGIMVEIPSAALDAGRLLPFADFLSIGTNDLGQYLFAASREEPGLEDYCRSMHPVLLRLIASVVRECGRFSKPVSLCGDLASDPFSAGLLVGLGLRRLSLQPRSLAAVASLLRTHTLETLAAAAEEAMACTTADEVLALKKNLAV